MLSGALPICHANATDPTCQRLGGGPLVWLIGSAEHDCTSMSIEHDGSWTHGCSSDLTVPCSHVIIWSPETTTTVDRGEARAPNSGTPRVRRPLHSWSLPKTNGLADEGETECISLPGVASQSRAARPMKIDRPAATPAHVAHLFLHSTAQWTTRFPSLYHSQRKKKNSRPLRRSRGWAPRGFYVAMIFAIRTVGAGHAGSS